MTISELHNIYTKEIDHTNDNATFAITKNIIANLDRNEINELLFAALFELEIAEQFR